MIKNDLNIFNILHSENNIADETLISFNRWAWRKNTDEGRTIALGAQQHDWSNNNTCFGYGWACFQKARFASIQGSPDGKWFLAATISDPKDPEKLVNYLWFYVAQEDDEFKTPDGKAMDYVKPGDLVHMEMERTHTRMTIVRLRTGISPVPLRNSIAMARSRSIMNTLMI